jgi:two-component system, NarL family, sensor histidine kinase UhpB
MSDAAAPPPAQSFFEGPGGSMLRAVHEAVVMIDATQCIVALNPAAERLLGCAAADALGQSLARFVPLPWRAEHGAWVDAFVAEQAPSRAMAADRRVSVQRADGRMAEARITLTRVEMNVGGRVQPFFAALMRDMGDEQALEQQLARLERRMRMVFEMSPIAIWICEGERLVFANRAAERLFGVASIDSLLGRSVYSLLAPDTHEVLREEIGRTLAGGPLGAIVAGRLLRPDGQVREIEIAFAPLPDHGQTTLQMVVNDVTQRRREAADLQRSQRALRELSANAVEVREEERRRIARELHDELGQRLSALKIDLSNFATAAGLAPDDTRLAGMTAMIDDTLASVRRIASDLRPLMLDDLGLNAAIEWLARDASRRIGFAVHARLPLTEPQVDQRVAIALYRMVQEALTNVARHAQAQSVEIELGVETGTQGESLRLTVSDDGVGLSDTALQRPNSFGLLGLRERAHMLGGEVHIGARRGGGTRLSVRLPAQPVAPAAPLSPAAPAVDWSR